MNDLVQWAAQYSAPVVMLLVLGAVLVFILRGVVERAVAAEFDRRGKRMELLLGRRSRFEERLLVEQYELVTGLQSALGKIAADVSRHRRGKPTDGLMRGRELVPLTELYVELEARRFLLQEPFHELLCAQAENLLAFANASDADEVGRLGREHQDLGARFRAEMNRVFGIQRVRWDALSLDD